MPAAVRAAWRAATDGVVGDGPQDRNVGRSEAAQAYRLLHTGMAQAVADGLIPADPCLVKGANQRDSKDRTERRTATPQGIWYRVPIIRMRQTGISEAVEIFARLNSKGRSMTADQMVSALTFRQGDQDVAFDLATEIDAMLERLGEQHFGDVDRSTILRAVLANLDEDTYRTDWTRMARDRKEALQERLAGTVERTNASVDLALEFLKRLGILTSRLLSYGLQLVLLGSFSDRCPSPTAQQLAVLARWFWVSSFSAWFGGANPSRITGLVGKFRGRLVTDPFSRDLEIFDLDAEALPFPLNFDMRSARARTLLLVMLSNEPSSGGENYALHAVEQVELTRPRCRGDALTAPSARPAVIGAPSARTHAGHALPLLRPDVPSTPLFGGSPRLRTTVRVSSRSTIARPQERLDTRASQRCKMRLGSPSSDEGSAG
ncbi:MAG: hypothetical protein ACYCXA_06910 [Actinomycetes bacterium]